MRTVYLSRETLRVVSTTPYTKDDLKRIQSESAAATDMSCEPVRPGAVKKDK